MSLPLTHAMVPLAAAIAFARRPFNNRLLAASVVAAIAPDLDSLVRPLFNVGLTSAYSHRGAFHSLFFALLAGIVAAALHRRLKAPPLTAGVAVTTAMMSHGLLDMLTASGKGVMFLWPLSSMRIYADWRPLPGSVASTGSRLAAVLDRLAPELYQVIAPMLITAIAIRLASRLGTREHDPGNAAPSTDRVAIND